MRDTLRLLRGLQEIDYELFRVRDELRRLPEELEKRRAQIDAERQGLSETEHRLQEVRARVKEIEDMTTAQRQRIRKLEGEAASSRADTALIVAYQHEIRGLRRDISEAEEEGLALVEQAEDLRSRGAEQKQAIERAEEDFAEYAANVEREIGEADARRRKLEGDRRERLGPVDPQVLATYEKLIEAREGQAMAELDAGRVCQGCYVNVPSNVYVRLARGLELVQCPSCGRILYLPDEA